MIPKTDAPVVVRIFSSPKVRRSNGLSGGTPSQAYAVATWVGSGVGMLFRHCEFPRNTHQTRPLAL